MVLGCGGAGKGVFSKELAGILRLPLIHLDRHFWRPGWRETPPEEWEETVRQLSSGGSWIMDGNYGGTLELRMERADTVVFLDFPRLVCLRGIFARRLRYAGRTRTDMAPGCPERLNPEFVQYVWNYRKTRRPKILRRLADLPDEKRSFILPDRHAAGDFLRVVRDQVRRSGNRT